MEKKSTYNNQLAWWKKAGNAMDGKPWVKNLLHRYPKEESADFEWRKNVSSYANYLATVADSWTSIFQRGKVNLVLPPELEDYRKNFDNKGTSIEDIRIKWMYEMIVIGDIFPKVDRPKEPRPESLADQKSSNYRPYYVKVARQNIVNWGADAFGNLLYVVECFKAIKDNKYYIYYRNEDDLQSIMDRLDCAKDDTEFINLMPFAREGYKTSFSDADANISPSTDILDCVIDLYNVDSQIVSLFIKIVFQFLAVPNGAEVDNLGSDTMVTVPQGSSIMPQWISPQADLFRMMFEKTDYLIKRIYQLSAIRDQSVDSAQKSGALVIVEGKQTEDKVKKIAQRVRAVELASWKLYCEGLDGDTEALFAKVELDYPEAYDVRSIEADVLRLIEIGRLKNRILYLNECQKVIQNKIKDPKEQKKAYDEFVNAVALWVEPNTATMTTAEKIDAGIYKYEDIAKADNSDFAGLTTEEATAKLIANKASNSKINGSGLTAEELLTPDDIPEVE